MIETPVSPSAYEFPLLIKQLLHTPLRCHPEQEIVSGEHWRYSYRTLSERIGQLAGALSKLGVSHGHTVAVIDWDCHRYLECFFAIPMIGAVLHTVNVRLSPEQILYTINHAEDDVILVHADFLPIINQIADRFDRPVTLVYLQDNPDHSSTPDNYAGEYEALLAMQPNAYAFPEFDEQTRATIFYTTGTTGDPKGVTYSHRQLVLHTLGLLAGFGPVESDCRFHRGDVYMPITPMFHVHGWGFPYAATLSGVKQVYPGRYDPSTLLKLIDTEQVTFSHCVPTILHMLLTSPDVDDVDLTGWKVIIGGSALPEGLASAALARGVNVFSAYGMSETCPVLTFAEIQAQSDTDNPEATVPARCKTGIPVPLVEIRVVDADMQDVVADGVATGEVVARAPWLAQGYVKNPEGSDALWENGYLHTGDVGSIDANGSLQITDRIKDVIKSGGEWISSLELESIASQCDGVSEVAAIGVPDEQWGERPLLLIVRTDDTTDPVTADSIKATISEQVETGRLSKWAVPDRIEFVESLDKTSVGKLNKKVLRQRYS